MFSINVKCAITVLAELEAAKDAPKMIAVSEIKRRTTYPRVLGQTMTILRKNKLVGYDSGSGRYWQLIDLESVSLYDLVVSIDGDIHMGNIFMNGREKIEWPEAKNNYCACARKIDNELDVMVSDFLKTRMLSDVITINSPL